MISYTFLSDAPELLNNLLVHLHKFGVDSSDIDECCQWAFGTGWRKLPIVVLPNRWNLQKIGKTIYVSDTLEHGAQVIAQAFHSYRHDQTEKLPFAEKTLVKLQRIRKKAQHIRPLRPDVQ